MKSLVNLGKRLEQANLRDVRIADKAIFSIAMDDLKSEEQRKVPGYHQKAIETALAMAANAKSPLSR